MSGGEKGAGMARGLGGKAAGGTPRTPGPTPRHSAPTAHPTRRRGTGMRPGRVGPELLVAQSG